MRTKSFLKHLFMGALLLATSKVVGQSTTPGNVALGATDFLGWNTNAANNFPLMVRHDLNQPIEWWTNTTRRMRLSATQSPNINGFVVPTDGFLGMSGHTNFFTGVGPFTRLHLADNSPFGILNAQQFAYRPWQRNGITFTGNADHGYIGQEHNGVDTTDMVIMWSNDFGVGQFAPDHLSIRFMSNFGNVATGATSMRGLEAMRFFPVDRDRVNVGVGDYIAGAINDPLVMEPTEILDVLEGRVRIRQLPDDPAAVDSFFVMVVDRTTVTPLNQERGVVKWIDPTELFPTDCDWVVQTPDPHVSSVYDGASCDWNMNHGVGIGVQFPKAKLHVYHTSDSILSPVAVMADSRFDYSNGEELHGTFSQARATVSTGAIQGMQAFGVVGKAITAKWSTGVLGVGDVTESENGTASDVIGVSGFAVAANNAVRCIGVYGRAGGAQYSSTWGFSNSWAGWFEGNVFSPYGNWTMSDGNLKQDIEDLENAGSLLSQLTPKSYSFNADEYSFMGLEPGLHLGLLAEEVEQVLPHAVRNVVRPEEVDSTGQVIHPEVTFKVMNYQEIIPLLIAGYKDHEAHMAEQAEAMQQLQDQMAQLQSQVAECCAMPSDDGTRSLDVGEELRLDPKAERLLSIQPNPFADHTTLTYTLERSGRMMLMVNSSDGKQLQVLDQADRNAGEYRFEWSTGHLSPGVYYVTLLLDGEPLVKRAVKVQ